MTIPVTQAEFDRLVATLQPGSFLVVATAREARIKGSYVEYVWEKGVMPVNARHGDDAAAIPPKEGSSRGLTEP